MECLRQHGWLGPNILFPHFTTLTLTPQVPNWLQDELLALFSILYACSQYGLLYIRETVLWKRPLSALNVVSGLLLLFILMLFLLWLLCIQRPTLLLPCIGATWMVGTCTSDLWKPFSFSAMPALNKIVPLLQLLFLFSSVLYILN